MTDEHALLRAIGDAARAETYLRDDWLTELENARESDLIAALINTAPADVEGRERGYRQIHEIRKFRENLQRIAASGRLAQAELDMAAKMVQKGNT